MKSKLLLESLTWLSYVINFKIIKVCSLEHTMWSNESVNYSSIHGIYVYVYKKYNFFYLQGNLWLQESCPLAVLLLHPVTRGQLLSAEGLKEARLLSFTYLQLGSDKTLQPVCGNEEPCLSVRVICLWPPPISLLTWQSPGPLLNLDVFSRLFRPPCSTLGGNKKHKKKVESTPSSHPKKRS